MFRALGGRALNGLESILQNLFYLVSALVKDIFVAMHYH